MKVLMLFDVKGWAWWHRIRNISCSISPEYKVDMHKLDEPFDHVEYDFVVILEAMFWNRVAHVPSEKVIVGCSCPNLIEETVSVLKSKHPAAGFVNNLEMFKRVQQEYRFYCCQNGVDPILFHPRRVLPRDLIACWIGSTRSLANKGLNLVRDACRVSRIPLLELDQSDNIFDRRLYTQERLRDQFYQRATVYICASECEGTPNPALEALACGLPVITTKVGNMPEVLRDGFNGFFVDRTVRSLSAGIERARTADLSILSRNARESILAGWTWKQRVKRYEGMFSELRQLQRQPPMTKPKTVTG